MNLDKLKLEIKLEIDLLEKSIVTSNQEKENLSKYIDYCENDEIIKTIDGHQLAMIVLKRKFAQYKTCLMQDKNEINYLESFLSKADYVLNNILIPNNILEVNSEFYTLDFKYNNYSYVMRFDTSIDGRDTMTIRFANSVLDLKQEEIIKELPFMSFHLDLIS